MVSTLLRDPQALTLGDNYLQVASYIILRFWLKTPFANTKICDLYAEMVQGRQTLIFHTILVNIANDYGYKISRFWANQQKYQTLVPAKKIVTLR